MYNEHRGIVRLCVQFITHIFPCPDSAATPETTTTPGLAEFIASALDRLDGRHHLSISFYALYLILQLKRRLPTTRARNGHSVYMPALMIATKMVRDGRIRAVSWCYIAQGVFTLHELNGMECEMCVALDWELNVRPEELQEFEFAVRAEGGFKFVQTVPTSLTTSTQRYVAQSPVPVAGVETDPMHNAGQVSVAKYFVRGIDQMDQLCFGDLATVATGSKGLIGFVPSCVGLVESDEQHVQLTVAH